MCSISKSDRIHVLGLVLKQLCYILVTFKDLIKATLKVLLLGYDTWFTVGVREMKRMKENEGKGKEYKNSFSSMYSGTSANP